MAGALDGLVVLDLTTHLSGPFCGMQLADMGADVIKIESPQGDSMRGAPPFIEGESAPFMLWNRNKRGLKLDLKNEDDLKVFWELVDGVNRFRRIGGAVLLVLIAYWLAQALGA
jgi:crotonobetainyl-CoA:carnitine CoA-transferase CaiB-like acyl-CoA transferase